MPDYISPDVDPVDPDELVAEAYSILTGTVPGYVPDDNSLENWLLLCLARIASTNATVAQQVPLSIFRYFGQTVIGLQPRGGSAAIAYMQVTAVDDKGYTFPTGTTVGYQATGDELIPFRSTNTITIPPGSTSTAAGAVTIEAVQLGTSGNGLAPADLIMVDALAWVDSLTALANTAGGVNAETDDEYIARLIAELQLLSPTPILPADFGSMARNVTGVYRAVGVDGYNPDDASTGNERMVAVAAIDGDGEPVPSGVKDAVKAYLESMRELGFVVNVFDPTYTTVDVDFTFTPYKDADAAAAQSAAINAVADYLSPKQWGTEEDDSVGITWVETSTLHRSEIMGILMHTDGIRYVNTLTIEGSPAEEVALTGPAALTRPGTITGAVAT